MAILDLFRPKWENSNWKTREEAIKTLTDQAVLAKIASKPYPENYTPSEQLLAIDRLTDQRLLFKVAKNAGLRRIRCLAIEKLKDEAALIDIAQNGGTSDARIAAIYKLSNQKILIQIAKNDKDEDVRFKAAARITDPAVCADIAKNDSYVGKELIKFYSGPIVHLRFDKNSADTVLADIAMNAIDKNVRIEATKKLTDQTVLMDITLRSDYDFQRTTAIDQIIVPSILANIAGKNSSIMVREAAIAQLRKLKDKWFENLSDAARISLESKKVLDGLAKDDVWLSWKTDKYKELLNKMVLCSHCNYRVFPKHIDTTRDWDEGASYKILCTVCDSQLSEDARPDFKIIEIWEALWPSDPPPKTEYQGSKYFKDKLK